MLSKLLAGKVCLVTGGAGDLGKAIAQAFLNSGAKVVVSDINQDLLKQCENEFPNQDFRAVNADVTKEESGTRLFAEVVEQFGKLDILVNNTGIMDHFDGAGDLDKALSDKVIAVNLTEPFIMTKLAVQHLLERKSKGTILNIGSPASIRGGAAGDAYTASKHGLLGLTKNTAASYGKSGICCNIVFAGFMETNISTSFTGGTNQAGIERIQMLMASVEADACNLEQMGETCAYLCSDGARVLNGAEIVADNGWSSY